MSGSELTRWWRRWGLPLVLIATVALLAPGSWLGPLATLTIAAIAFFAGALTERRRRSARDV